ncbi:MAG: flavin reductase family protein [Phycisphaerae bacterium]|nr:flavin reductase family protein [Phycisphaerae bacterium]
MHLDPATLAPADCYKLLIGGIIPRPIAWVSTLAPDGRPNLAPFSFFAGCSSNPMALLFCPANKPDGSPKDSLRNAASPAEGGTGEFVVSTVPDALARTMAATAEPLDFGDSEWTLAGVESARSVAVAPARVAASPLAFECVTDRIIRLNPGVPAGGNIVLGRVVGIYVRDDAIDPRFHLDPAALDSVARMGGSTYCRSRDRFDLPFGKAAIQPDPR